MQDVRTSLEQRLNERIASAASSEIPEMMALSHFLETIALNVYAEQIFRRVTEIDAHHEEAWLGLARTTPNCRDAVACVRHCLEFNPNSPKAQAALIAANKRLQAEAQTFVDQGTVLLKAGKRVEAREVFAKAIDLDPQNDCAWVGCARSTDDWRSRSNLANHALRINPENEAARLLYVATQDSQSQPTPSRWSQFVRFLVPAGIAVAALTVAFISTVAR
jgi:tetratricopeptide (TPR) repeat protein